MKLGILTFHRAANYGAVLQVYALQHYLLSKGYDTEIIDYKCNSIEHVHSPLYFLYCRGWLKKCKQFLRSIIKSKKRRLFNHFIDEHLRLSKTRNITKDSIQETAAESYDVIIAGSDQIWNPYLTNNDTTYLLDFVSSKVIKISYAASIGVAQLPSACHITYRKLLKKFDAVSVREKQGQLLLNNICKKNYKIMLDPTLLLSSEDWKRFMVNPPYNNYILLYTIKPDKKLEKYALEAAKKKQMPLIYISDTLLRRKKIIYIPYATPEEWVGLFAGASYIITNSFHGTAFSISFNKKFIIGLSTEPHNVNSRIIDLLRELEITATVKDTYILSDNNINWDTVNFRLKEMRKTCFQFLDISINGKRKIV